MAAMTHEMPHPLYPVILPVEPADRRLKGRDRVAALSRRARVALAASARLSGAPLEIEAFRKDGEGVPLPAEGLYWSLSHKPRYVAAAVAPHPVGIDVEELRPCRGALFRKVAASQEWALLDAALDPADRFFRFWTAKEAVLKATGVGFKGISGCRVIHVSGPHRLTIDFLERSWQIEQVFFNGHIAAIVCGNRSVRWQLPED